jgi:capsular polysaccharide biosynthesis protein
VDPYRESIEDFLRRWRSRYEGNRVFRVLVITVVLAAVGVASASYLQPPTYEASAQVWVDQKPGDQQMGSLANQAGSGEMIKTLPPKGAGLQAIIQPLVYAIDSRPVAEEAIQRLNLDMTSAELLDNLTVEQIEDTSFIVLTYEDTSPVRAKQIVNTVGEVSSKLISDRSRTFTATVYEKAAVPDSAVSPHPLRNGLVTLVIGLALCVGASQIQPGIGARLVDTLGVWNARRRARMVSVPRLDPLETERIKEKELLQALGRRGKLTAVEAALETSLSVEEADRLLQDLAAKGQLQVDIEDGRLVFSFWERGA